MMIGRARAAKLRKLMDELKVEAMVTSTRENFAYLTGFHSPLLDSLHYLETYVILNRSGDRALTLVLPEAVLYPFLEREDDSVRLYSYGRFCAADARETGQPQAVNPYKNDLAKHFASAASALVHALKQANAQTTVIGIDFPALKIDAWGQLINAFPSATFRPMEQALRRFRSVKEPEELDLIRRAIHITEAGIRQGIEVIKNGGSEREFANSIYEHMVLQGARPGCYLVGFGESGAYVVNPSELNRARPGIPLKIDVGCVYNGYWSDLARTYALGCPCKKVREYYAALTNGHRAAISTIKHGVPASVPFHAAVEAVRASGIPHYDRNHCGHGVGLELWEHPLVQPDADQSDKVILEAGMVLNIEVPYYELGFGALTVEDTILVEENGCQVLSSLPRELEL